MIELFEHNKTAYDSAVSMLSDTGKAAIIHPTGTGKSFIGFKLCEDHPDKTVCWLSPSEYIFKTQLENLAKVSNGFVPENVRFFTYAKLMLLFLHWLVQFYIFFHYLASLSALLFLYSGEFIFSLYLNSFWYSLIKPRSTLSLVSPSKQLRYALS